MYGLGKRKQLNIVVTVISIIVLIISVLGFVIGNIDMSIILMIQQFWIGVIMFIAGRESVIDRKNKMGYLYYVVGVLSFVALYNLLKIVTL